MGPSSPMKNTADEHEWAHSGLWAVTFPGKVGPIRAHRQFSTWARMGPLVMTILRKISDFVYFLPFLFSMYHHPEPSGTFYDDPPTSVMTHTLDRSSMT